MLGNSPVPPSRVGGWAPNTDVFYDIYVNTLPTRSSKRPLQGDLSSSQKSPPLSGTNEGRYTLLSQRAMVDLPPLRVLRTPSNWFLPSTAIQ